MVKDIFDRFCSAQPRASRLLQIRGLFYFERKRRDGIVPEIAARRASHRHQLLYVPDPELRCRCVPKGRSRAEKLFKARNVYRDVPAAHCGSHRALRGDRAAAGRAGDDVRGYRGGRGPVRDRTIEKGSAGERPVWAHHGVSGE